MPRKHRAQLETQVRQINQMFGGGSRPIIEITKPCNLHNRKGSIDIIHSVSKRNSVDIGDYCGTPRLNPALNTVQRRAKSVDHTALSKSLNRNSTTDLFSGKYIDVTKRNSLHSVFGRSEKELRRKSYFDGMEHPADFPGMLRNFQALSASKTKLNGHNSNNNLNKLSHTSDTNNNNTHTPRLSVTPEKTSFLDTENYLRKPKRLSFDVTADTFNHLTTTTLTPTSTTTNRKLSLSSADSLECLRSPSRRHSTLSHHSTSPKPHYFDSADIEKEVRRRVKGSD